MPSRIVTSALAIGLAGALAHDAGSATYFVRQTAGDDRLDGMSPETAWRHVRRLGRVLRAGDAAYVGPGLYREELRIRNRDTANGRIRVIADPEGRHTGDPPGPVMITGAEPVEESLFGESRVPGVAVAPFAKRVLGVTEMDGPQTGYARAVDTPAYRKGGSSELEAVRRSPASFFYDPKEELLYVHTSDGRLPGAHEMEVIVRSGGITVVAVPSVTVSGFTIRHTGLAGVGFFRGAANGIAAHNTSYGSRQGIVAYDSAGVLLHSNVLFRNGDSGAYFLSRSADGMAVGNLAYENAKGLRWGKGSVNAYLVDNLVFANHELGISIEDAAYSISGGNRLIRNGMPQLRADGDHDSWGNCVEESDLRWWKNGCGRLPARANVQELHEEATSYAERARRELGDSRATPGERSGSTGKEASRAHPWWKRLLGW